MSKVKMSVKNITRKQWLVVAIGGVLLILTAGFVWQELSWRHYVEEKDLQVLQIGVTAQSKLQSVSTEESAAALMTWLAGSASSLCAAPLFTEVRTSISYDAREGQSRCHAYQSEVQAAAQAAGVFHHHLQSNQDIADIIDSAAGKLKLLDSSKYSQREKVWAEAKFSLEELAVVGTAKSLKEAQIESINSIIKGYQGVSKADEAKNRSEFDKSVDALTHAYGSLADTSEKAKNDVTPLAQRLVDAVTALR